MPIEIPDLWSDDIKVDVLPPLVILKAQSAPISRKTSGILHTEVTTTIAHQGTPEATATHVLDLVAPALNYSESLLEVTHKLDRMYPATVTVPDPIPWKVGHDVIYDVPCAPTAPRHSVAAESADELIGYLRQALRAPNTRSAIESVLARTNEARIAGELAQTS